MPCSSLLADNTIDHVRRCLETETLSWHQLDIENVLKDVNTALSIKQKSFMTTLRHALTATKVGRNLFINLTVLNQSQTGPSVPEIMLILGHERTLSRLLPKKAR